MYATGKLRATNIVRYLICAIAIDRTFDGPRAAVVMCVARVVVVVSAWVD